MLLLLLLDAFKQRKCLKNADVVDSLDFFVVAKAVWQHMCSACCRRTEK